MNNNIHATAGLLDDIGAAEFFNVKKRTIRYCRPSEDMRHVRISTRVIRYTMADLQSWMDSRMFQIVGGAK